MVVMSGAGSRNDGNECDTDGNAGNGGNDGMAMEVMKGDGNGGDEWWK